MFLTPCDLASKELIKLSLSDGGQEVMTDSAYCSQSKLCCKARCRAQSSKIWRIPGEGELQRRKKSGVVMRHNML